jgi:hypothetical protein
MDRRHQVCFPSISLDDVLLDCVHEEIGDSTMSSFADQDGKDTRDVSLIDPTRHGVVPDPKQAPRLYGPNRDDDTRGANAEVGRHLVGQDQLAGVHVDNLNMHQESGETNLDGGRARYK